MSEIMLRAVREPAGPFAEPQPLASGCMQEEKSFAVRACSAVTDEASDALEKTAWASRPATSQPPPEQRMLLDDAALAQLLEEEFELNQAEMMQDEGDESEAQAREVTDAGWMTWDAFEEMMMKREVCGSACSSARPVDADAGVWEKQSAGALSASFKSRRISMGAVCPKRRR
ncbi:hypothetical protein FVE85_3186 [Porphyridium purpureum]|uniref:Uncharacterized protein n=1 Tax=Porphyridium purpureum TaxID=35688 RepID=A0A5J4YUM0_PORPP|nr:hypothetical protein FVE85_3186 [Porphyridium purpureum]|eukprot:POR4524..scf227_4